MTSQGVVPRVAAATAAGVGSAALVGWAFDLPLLTSIVPGLSSMKVNTAAAFILAGAFELQATLAEVKVLQGILPICATCKRIRDDDGQWEAVESYVRERTNAEFTHGLCPDCAKKTWGSGLAS